MTKVMCMAECFLRSASVTSAVSCLLSLKKTAFAMFAKCCNKGETGDVEECANQHKAGTI